MEKHGRDRRVREAQVSTATIATIATLFNAVTAERKPHTIT